MPVRPSLAILLLCLAAAPMPLKAQLASQFSTQPTPSAWHAEWIAAPTGPARDQDVLYFRKSLTLPAIPAHFLVNVSADNRFELHVNGQRVGAGPALSDLQHWRYETFDLGPISHRRQQHHRRRRLELRHRRPGQPVQLPNRLRPRRARPGQRRHRYRRLLARHARPRPHRRPPAPARLLRRRPL